MSHTKKLCRQTRYLSVPHWSPFRCWLQIVPICLLAAILCQAQSSAVPDRTSEWNKYQTPAADFVRIVDEASGVVFHAPAGWTRGGPDNLQQPTFRFNGPHSALIQVSIEKLPDGFPLTSYVAAILQQLRNVPGASELAVRRTDMSGLAAREVMFEVPDENGELSRRVIWCTVNGPVAVAVLLIGPSQHRAEIEPYLRAVVQSVSIPGKEKLEVFELVRTNAINEAKPARIDQIQAVVATVDGLNPEERETAVAKLTQLFITAPDVGVDLLLDRRPLVRAAAIDAIARSNNRSLDPFLVKALSDTETIVAERGGRALATRPNALALLRDETVGWMNTGRLARVWPFLDKQTQLQILDEVFGVENRPARRPAKPGAPPVRIVGNYSRDSSTQLGLMTLMIDLPVQDFRLPLAVVLKARNDVLTAAALHVAIARDEKLDANELLKLLSAGSTEVRRLAAVNLAESATTAHLAQIEAAQKNLAKPNPDTVFADSSAADKNTAVASELQHTIKKIRLREQLSALSGERRQAAITAALADPQIADWVWLRYVSSPLAAAGSAVGPPKAPSLSLREENVFPDRLTHYLSVQKPADLLNKLGESLQNIKMDSARSQANVVLVINAVQGQLAAEFGAPAGATITEYAGVNATARISVGSWNLAGVPLRIPGAQRRVVLVRVGDRSRFERTLARYQEQLGSFASLPDGLAISARFFGALPAILPISASELLSDKPSKKKNVPILKYTLSGQTEVSGHPVKYIGQRRVFENGEFTHDGVYVIYAGNVALLAPDLSSLRDVLARVNNGGPSIETNPQYKAALAGGGDAVYFSNLTELIAEPGAASTSQTREHGALTISNSAWENSYYLASDDDSESKFLLSLNPGQLFAPRELLPRSTLLYYFMKVSPADALVEWNRLTEGKQDPADVWALNFQQEVLPEFEGECGAAVLGWPNLSDEWSAPWIVFFKLKSNRLAQAFNEGRLFKAAGAGKDVAKIQFEGTDLYVTITNDFLILADAPGTLDQLKQPEKLTASPDFAKAVKRTPASVAAFAGYNLDVMLPTTAAGSDAVQTQTANMILSLARAFHSPSFYATVNSGNIEAHSSISLDRGGRYSVAELQAIAKSEPAYAAIQPGGIPISNQNRLKHLSLRIQVKAAGGAERIAEDVATDSQIIERRAAEELALKVLPRTADAAPKVQLPISASEFAPYLKATPDIRADDQTIIDKAKEIVGTDRDAWSVARKLSDWTHANITWKLVDDANAAQTLATREADCYEFSKLYVAMARSLGLPARIVSGLAYSGSSFGGHAWVEVYIGRWIELDPTWGTNFVDATHIKTSNGALVSYATLELIKVDVLEARRGAAEYQADAPALAKKLCEELSAGTTDALESALDVAAVTDDLMGAGTWASLTDKERDQISGPFRRVITGFASNFKKSHPFSGGLRLLKVRQEGNRAEALAMQGAGFSESLLKLSMIRHEEVWMLREILEVDTGLRMIAENLEPAIQELRSRRNGQPQRAMFQTDFARVMLVLEKNAHGALDLADRLLKQKPNDVSLRYLKSLALGRLDKGEEAAKIWAELSAEDPPFGPALRSLAEYHESSENEGERKQAENLYQRYILVEPDDPRARTGLAGLHYFAGDFARAESEYRAAVERDPSNSIVFVDLAEFYAMRSRFSEAVAVIDEAVKRTGDEEDLFADLLSRFLTTEEFDVPEGLAASQPQRMAKSARANIVLARIKLNRERGREAVPLLKKAAALDPKSSEPHEMLAEAYRSMRDWASALVAANTAIKLQPEDAYGHWERACALARLGRTREAMASLKRAIELDEDLQEVLAEEEDLKPLSRLPEFKKLLPPPEPSATPTVKNP